MTKPLPLTDPHHSAWTQAHAGTGKTHILVERFLRLLLAGEDARSILCLTYTRNAAFEMKERLLQRLGRWWHMADDQLHDELERMEEDVTPEKKERARELFSHCLNHYHDLQLTTIHAFCQMVLRRFPLEAGVEPVFELCDEGMEESLRHEALQSLVQRAATEPTSQTAEALARIVTISSETNPFAKGSSSGWHDALKQLSQNEVSRSYDINQLLKLHEGDSAIVMARAFAQLHEIAPEEINDYIAQFLTQKGEMRKRIEIKSEYKRSKPVEAYSVYQFYEQWSARQATEDLAHSSRLLLRIGRAYMDELTAIKRRNAVLFYDDLIEQTTRLVRDSHGISWVMYKLDQAIRHVLIDEAQDTDERQWEMIFGLTQDFTTGSGTDEERTHAIKRSFFSVGDPKQSIYGFKGASPAVFEEAYKRFKACYGEVQTDVAKRGLHHSFRSSPVILQAVDGVFADNTVRAGVVAEGETLRHQASDKTADLTGSIEVWSLQAKETQQKKDDNPFAYPPQTPAVQTEHLLADRIASYVRQLIDDGSAPNDIMILVRTRKDIFRALMPALKKYQVIAEEPDRFNPFDHMAVQDLMAVARFALDINDDLSLAEVLKSPLCDLRDDDLEQLTVLREDQSLWQGLKKSSRESHRCAHELLSDILARSDYQPLYEFFASLAHRLTYAQHDHDAVTYFLDEALRYEQRHGSSLQLFVHEKEQWQRGDVKREISTSFGHVKISTIHGAKGLEADTVILADASDAMGGKDAGGLLKGMSGELPLWTGASSIAKGAPMFVTRQRIEQDKEKQSRNRLLYVAMTRAKRRLVVAGIERSGSDNWHAIIEKNVSSKSAVTLPRPMPSDTMHKASHDISALLSRQPADDMKQETPPMILVPSAYKYDEEVVASGIGGDDARQRGIIIHQLLDYLPTIDEDEREKRARVMVHRWLPTWSKKLRESLVAETLAVMAHEQLALLFGDQSRGEVAITGLWRGRRINGRVDRLAYHDGGWLCADFKTGAEKKELPASWLAQMALYDVLLANINPDTARAMMIVETQNCRVHHLSQQQLREARQKWLDQS